MLLTPCIEPFLQVQEFVAKYEHTHDSGSPTHRLELATVKHQQKEEEEEERVKEEVVEEKEVVEEEKEKEEEVVVEVGVVGSRNL